MLQEIKKHRARRVLYLAVSAALFLAMLVPVFMKRGGTAASVWELISFTLAVWCLNAAKNEWLLIARLEKESGGKTTDKGN